jgi:hypothetical protein
MRNRILNLSLARQIREAGRPIVIAEDDTPGFCEPSRDVLINQTGGGLETRAFDHSGGTAWLISISIAVKKPGFAISSFAIETPWEKMGFCWIADPLERTTDRIYRLDSLRFDRDEILNHRADSKRLQRGTFMDGFLLGTDMATIPKKFRCREVDVILVIYDQFDQQHRASLTMLVDRVTKQQSKPRTKRAGLFECPDPEGWVDPRYRYMTNLMAESAERRAENERKFAKYLESLETTIKT